MLSETRGKKTCLKSCITWYKKQTTKTVEKKRKCSPIFLLKVSANNPKQSIGKLNQTLCICCLSLYSKPAQNLMVWNNHHLLVCSQICNVGWLQHSQLASAARHIGGETSLGLKDLLPRWLIPMATMVAVDDRETTVPLHVSLSEDFAGVPHLVLAGFQEHGAQEKQAAAVLPFMPWPQKSHHVTSTVAHLDSWEGA